MRATDFIYEFDWMGYAKQADQLVDKPELLEKADLETLRKLFTAHSRNEALKDGHLAEMIDNGHLQNAVARLVALLWQKLFILRDDAQIVGHPFFIFRWHCAGTKL